MNVQGSSHCTVRWMSDIARVFHHSEFSFDSSLLAVVLPINGSACPRVSRREIALSLGIDNPSEVLFVTDLLPEAEAARRAGLRTVLSIRPGNTPLPEVSQCSVRTVLSPKRSSWCRALLDFRTQRVLTYV